jgi:predicted PurR-regulated permease PerM
MSYRSHEVRVDPERRRQIVFAVTWAAIVVTLLVSFRSVLVPFIMAAVIAYVLSPIARRLQAIRIGPRPLPRWAVVLGIYVALLAGLAASIAWAVPAIAGEVRDFAREEVPRLTEAARTRWLPMLQEINRRFGGSSNNSTPPRAANEVPALGTTDHTIHVDPQPGGGYRVVLPVDGLRVEPDRHGGYRVVPVPQQTRTLRGETDVMLDRLRALGAGHTEDIIRVGRGIVGLIVGGIFGFFITLMLSAYMLLTEQSIVGFVRSLVHPTRRPAFDELLTRIDRGLSGVVRGQLIICAVNGVLSAIGFGIAGLPYWPLLALLAAVLSLVPIFGSILSSVPAVLIGLRQGLPTALFTLAWIVGIHQLEANLLNPKIMGDAAKIHPVLVVFSLLAGEHFFGILGALLAVPAMSLLQSVFLHWRKYALSYGDPQVAVDSFTPPERISAAPEPPPERR